ncbi:hypothetical protein RB653_006344 [Dictyostelium firmibasis]|uniref:Uncharacterized protein n=1 Tax=Dictyostelium firmibasis TaxID=79012 RepID=A0AAN7UD95_9MYCE
MTQNNNETDTEKIERLKKKIEKIKEDKIENEKNLKGLQLSSRPTYLVGGIFGLAAIYYNIKNKKTLAKFSLLSSGLIIFSGHLIDRGEDKPGSILAGCVSAVLSGTTLASGFKNKKILPLALGSVAVASMSYHGFFSLYNSLDKVKDVIDSHNENAKLIKEEQQQQQK